MVEPRRGDPLVTRAPGVTASCRVTVAGPLGAAATQAIEAQYGRVVVSPHRVTSETVLVVDGLDQPALRGLLVLLWDFGHDVVAVSHQPKGRTS